MEETAKTMQEGVIEAMGEVRRRTEEALIRARLEGGRLLDEEDAQGTTEYAILVGVLVVIAILAIVAFRDNLSELWDDITDGINSL